MISKTQCWQFLLTETSWIVLDETLNFDEHIQSKISKFGKRLANLLI